MTRVKICGLMSRTDVNMAVGAGADSLGFVTEYPVPVPWNISREQAKALVASASIRLPLILAGGLRVENVRQAIRLVRPYAVDVISGVEREPGMKDARLMKDFVMAVRGEDYGDD